MLESAVLLFLVIDPFGNLPFVLGVLGNSAPQRYRQIIARETFIALLVLVIFALSGEEILHYLGVSQSSVSVAGGVILFLISLKMVFHTSAQIFDDDYSEDPLLVPIAVPALAGPSAITTVMILHGGRQVPLFEIIAALSLVFAITAVVFLLGERIRGFLGRRGIQAMEKFMGLLLNLVAVNFILQGIREFWVS